MFKVFIFVYTFSLSLSRLIWAFFTMKAARYRQTSTCLHVFRVLILRYLKLIPCTKVNTKLSLPSTVPI